MNENARAAHVAALQTERDYLARQPHPNEVRIGLVDEQLKAFSSKPDSRTRETAVNPPEGPQPPAQQTSAPAKKAAAKRAPAKKAATKRAASKSS